MDGVKLRPGRTGKDNHSLLRQSSLGGGDFGEAGLKFGLGEKAAAEYYAGAFLDVADLLQRVRVEEEQVGQSCLS